LKTNKYEFLVAAGVATTVQFVRYSYIPVYLFLLALFFISFYIYKPKIRFDALNFVPMFFYVSLALISLLLLNVSLNKDKAIIGIINAFVFPALFYVFLISCNGNFILKIEKIWLFLLAIASVVCIFEFLYYIAFKSLRERTISIFFNPNTFAFFLVMVYPLVINKLKDEKSKLLVSFLIFIEILLSGSRTGFVVYIFEFFLINIYLIRKNILKVFLAVAGILTIFLPKILYRIPSLSDVTNPKTAVGQRVFVIEFVLRYFSHRSLFEGIGAGQFELFFRKLKAPGIVALHSAHNLFLNALIEYGIIGYMILVFIVYFSVFLSAYNFFKHKEEYDRNILIGFILITIFQMFDMAEITNSRMLLINMLYTFYLFLPIYRFKRWRAIDGKYV
jgi:O-antigen ligase